MACPRQSWATAFSTSAMSMSVLPSHCAVFDVFLFGSERSDVFRDLSSCALSTCPSLLLRPRRRRMCLSRMYLPLRSDEFVHVLLAFENETAWDLLRLSRPSRGRDRQYPWRKVSVGFDLIRQLDVNSRPVAQLVQWLRVAVDVGSTDHTRVSFLRRSGR